MFLDAATAAFYANFSPATHPDAPSVPLVGPATHFVSHAWAYKLEDVVSVLEEIAAEAAAACQPAPYFWFDLVVNNQHQAPERGFEWWCTTFKDSIARIGRVVAIFSPWNHPVPLTRAWCLYELFAAVDRNVVLDVRLPASQRQPFLDAVSSNFQAIMDAMSEIDVRNAQAFADSDRRNILQAVEASVGCAQLNELVKERLRQWYRDSGLQAIAAAEAQGRNDTLEYAQLAQALGSLLRRDYGDLPRATQLLDAALEVYFGLCGAESLEVAACLYQRALVLYDAGDYKGAQKMLQRVLTLRQQLVAPDHLLVAEVLNTQATVLRNLGDYTGAVDLHEQALALRRQHLGPHHADVASTLNNMSAALMKLHEWDRARACMREALEIWQRIYGARHPQVAIAYNNLAHAAEEAAEWTEAISLHQAALDIRREALGDLHPKTAASLNNLGALLVKRGQAQGVLYLEQALAVRERQLGVHMKTANTLVTVAQAAADVGDRDKARRCWQRARDMRRQLLHPQHPLVTELDQRLGDGGGSGGGGGAEGGGGDESGGNNR